MKPASRTRFLTVPASAGASPSWRLPLSHSVGATALSSSPGPSKDWNAAVGAKTAYIEPGSPWENGKVENFNARLRDELLDREIICTLAEARIIIESRATGHQLPKSSFLQLLWRLGSLNRPHRPR
jgi:hypothetical protein